MVQICHQQLLKHLVIYIALLKLKLPDVESVDSLEIQSILHPDGHIV